MATSKKRAYGSGSKREVRPNVWQLRVGGRSSTFHGTGKDAEKELARLVVASNGVVRRQDMPTLAELIDQWRHVARHEAATAATYDHALEHLPDKLARTKIDKLALRHFDRTYRELERAGVGASMIRKLHSVLSAALTQAVRWELIPNHPARGAELPTVRVKPRRVLSLAEIAAVLDATRDSLANEAFFRLAIATGGRVGELCAIRWGDIDLTAQTLTISRALRADRSTKGTKTDTTRVIQLDAGTVDVLERWRKGQVARAKAAGIDLIGNCFVLSNAPDSSVPWKPQSASQRWERLAARAGVTGVNMHALRHTHVSMLIRSGVDIATVAKRAGHSRPTTTLDMYTHVFDSADREAADMIGQWLNSLPQAR